MARSKLLGCFLRWTMVICTLCLSPPVFAHDKIIQKSWVEDPSGELSLAAVQKLSLENYSGVLSRGFGDSVVWIRLRIDPHLEPSDSRGDRRLVLRIRPVYLDDIQVFDPLTAGAPLARTGDFVHPRDDELQGLDFLVPVARGESPRDIWVRVKSISTRQIDIQALNANELQNISRTVEIVAALYFSLLFMFTVWGLTHWVFQKEAMMGAFALMQACAMMYAFFSLGLARALWPASWPAIVVHQATSIWSVCAVSSAIYFHTLLTHELSLPRWIDRLYAGMLLILPLKLVLLATGLGRIALQINMVEVLIAPLVFLATSTIGAAWTPQRTDKLPTLSRSAIFLFYSLMALLLIMAAAPGLALGNATEMTLHLVQVHGLLTAFIIYAVLQYRTHIIQNRQRDDQLALKASQIQTDHERGMREERENLLTMLTHELKTPLATIQMRVDPHARGSREIKQAIRDMNGVIERCVQALQLSDQHLVMRQEVCDLVDAIREVALSCAQPQWLSLELPDSLLITTDRQLLFIVIGNLIENACKYAAPETPISIRTVAKHQGVEISISNHPGIAGWPDETRVFEKYYRSPHAKRQAGTGLGLYLVRHILQAMNGNIRFAPDSNWVKFVVTLPLTSAMAAS